jgi:Tol biopolymer transport system component
LSPDASRLAVVCFDETGERLGGVRIITLEGELDAVLHEDAAAGSPTWSQDGRYVVYWVESDAVVRGRPGTDLWAVAVDQTTSSDPVPLTDDASKDSVPALSPNNDWIVFTRATSETRSDLYLIKVRETGSGLVPEAEQRMGASTPSPEADPVWSLDGSRILYSVGGQFRTVAPAVDANAEPFFSNGATTDGLMMAWARR